MDLEEQDELQSEFSTGLSPWLKIFFGAVALCAVFFALGYTFGRNSAPITSTTLTSDPKPVVNASADKPSAAQSQNAALTETQNVPSQQSDLTFYKSVENKPDGQLSPPPAQQTKPAQTQATQSPSTTPATDYLQFVEVDVYRTQADCTAGNAYFSGYTTVGIR